MKIQIEINDVNVIVETPCYADTLIGRNDVMNVCDKVYNVIESICNPDKNTNITKEENQCQPEIPPKKDTMVIRPRIPNNIVDVKDLSIKKAVTENALVRCPKCGQAHCLAVSSGSMVYLMERDFNTNDFNIIAEFDSLNEQPFIDVCCKPETDRLAYFNDLQNAYVLNHNDFAVDNDSEIFCPVCCESSSFLEWKQAFDNPLQYFETEHICDVCGGEKLEKIIRDKKVYLCDSCGYQTEFEEE